MTSTLNTHTVSRQTDPGSSRRRAAAATWIGVGVGRSLIWLLVAFDVFILLFMLVSSLKTTKSIFASPWSVPTSPHFENWAHAWSGSGFGHAALNTVAVTACATIATVSLAAPAAYMLSRVGSRSAAGLTGFFAVGLGIPAQVMVIPLFVGLSHAGLTNSLVGLFLVYVAVSLPFAVFLLTGFFRSLPEELEEAASLDGASPWRTFWQIMLPVARSGISTALVLNLVMLWNETFIALIFIQSNGKYTLSLSLLGFLSREQFTGADYGALFAGACILVLPMLGVYVVAGRKIVEGITMGIGK